MSVTKHFGGHCTARPRPKQNVNGGRIICRSVRRDLPSAGHPPTASASPPAVTHTVRNNPALISPTEAWLRRSHSATRLWLGPTAFPISQGVCRRLLASRYRSYDEMNTSRIVQPSIAWAHYFRLKNPKQLALKACNYATACTELDLGKGD